MSEASIDPKKLEKLCLLLYPENLEQYSKVITILNEDFSFDAKELFSLKEITKIFDTKDALCLYLTHLSKQEKPIISINEDFTKCTLLIDENSMFYQFINLPPDFNETNVKESLGIKDSDYLRLYKFSLFWVMVTNNTEFITNFEKTKFEIVIDEKKLKCNVTSAAMLKNVIKAIIEKRNYNKETEALKNSLGAGNNSQKKESKKSDDSMSWRKKSDNDDNEIGYGYKKNSNNEFYGVKRRQRFGSDPVGGPGNNRFYNDNKNVNNEVEELKIQLNDVKYPIFIKEKYNNREILGYFAKIKNEIKYDDKIFTNFIDDVIDKDKMKVIELESKKEFEVPKNNPLLNFKKK